MPARRAAWDAVAEVLRRRAALDDVIEAKLGGAGLGGPDAALARAIAVVTFRHFGTLRRALGERLSKRLPDDERLLALLACGAAQVLFLDVPDHAAVDLSVRLAAGDRRTTHAAGMVNAVLRRIARERDAILARSDPLGVDTPAWLATRWIARYGADAAAAIAAVHGEAASVDITVKGEPEAWAARLGGIVLPTGSVRLIERTPVRELPGYDEGAWWVQDAAAALPARVLAPRPGERIADLCAAPGGKTAQLACTGAAVVAVDKSESRMRRLQENMARLRLSADLRTIDVLDFEDEPFDAVLLDAPCSATGTIRRHPDVPWVKREADIPPLADLQRRLIDKAASLVRPGGRLVYCTCSLEAEEGEQQVERFLRDNPAFGRAPIDPIEIDGIPDVVDRQGDLRTLPCQLSELAPGRRGLDGFFVARLIRRAA